MPKCSLTNCKNITSRKLKEDGISYFRFPRDPIRCGEWTSIVSQQRGEDFFKPNDSSVVCSEHFLDEDMYVTAKGIQRLRKTAVPSVVDVAPQDLKINEDFSPSGNQFKVFCPKCNTEVQHTAEGIQEDQTKILIAKVYHYFECEYEELKKKYGDLDLTPLSKFSQRTAMATGVSETTVLQILKEEKERSAEKREEKKRSRARKRSLQTESSSEAESSDDNDGDGGEPSYEQEPQNEADVETETLVVKIEPECDKDPFQIDTIPVEVKVEPPDNDVMFTIETVAPTEPAATKRKGRKIPKKSDVTSTRQHTQGESSTSAASSSVRRKEAPDESGLLGETAVKMEEIEIGVEEFS